MPFRRRYKRDQISELSICSPDGLMTSCRSENFNLELHVKTGKTKFSATDSTVSVRFCSEKSKSEWTKLDNWGNDFENGSLGKYLLKIEEIGTIEKIDVKLDGLLTDLLFLDYLDIKKKDEESFTRFPYYQWIRKGASIVSSEASLPQNDSKIRSQWRKRHLGYFQSLLPWKAQPIMKGFINQPDFGNDERIPLEIFWPVERDDEFADSRGTLGKC